jgi:hypothetical protein
VLILFERYKLKGRKRKAERKRLWGKKVATDKSEAMKRKKLKVEGKFESD